MTVDDDPKILIIDDEQIVLDSCTRILERGAYDIATATNGTSGLEMVTEFQPDLIFVDLMMPGISGLEVLEQVAAIDPTIVKIVITGYATVSSAVDAMKRGAYDFLPKPFTPDEFRLITGRGLERRRLQLETIRLRREKEMLREHFAAIVSHELKSPLAAVQQNLFVLAHQLEPKLTDDENGRLERMKSKIDDLIKLIHTWLRVMRVDISKIAESFEPTDVARLVEKAVDSVDPHAVRKDVELRADVADGTCQIMADETTMVEALVNIIGNAVKYTYPSTAVVITAVCKGDEVTVAVRDSGVGIAPEDLPYVFDDFFRAESGRQAAGGSGLGLAITRRIVEAHGGSLHVESELGKGSTFVMKLAAYQGAGDQAGTDGPDPSAALEGGAG